MLPFTRLLSKEGYIRLEDGSYGKSREENWDILVH